MLDRKRNPLELRRGAEAPSAIETCVPSKSISFEAARKYPGTPTGAGCIADRNESYLPRNFGDASRGPAEDDQIGGAYGDLVQVLSS